jgi:uncharacterized protein
MKKELKDIFPKKPIIGMIHLAGDSRNDRIRRALDELILYEQEGVDGAIIEDYHGTDRDVIETLKQSNELGFKIVRGVNLLRGPYQSFQFAYEYGGKFIQFDSVQTQDLNLQMYDQLKLMFSSVVLGGVGFKYIQPTGNPLKQDLDEAMSRCEAIVTTGAGTGIETPTIKLVEYKEILGNFPLIVGAGVNEKNAQKQFEIADGAIIGSYFKRGCNTHNEIDRSKVRDIVQIMNQTIASS